MGYRLDPQGGWSTRSGRVAEQGSLAGSRPGCGSRTSKRAPPSG